MQIIIDPRTRISYASYYIVGLWEVFGKKNITFGMKPFHDLNQKNGLDDFDQYFAFVCKDEKEEKRVIIDYRDKSNLSITALSWCNVYGKVNFNRTDPDYTLLDRELTDKIFPIGTNFGVRIWKTAETGWHLVFNYLQSLTKLPVNFRTFLSGYNWQLKREKIEFYQSAQSLPDYVFHASSLYINQAYGDTVNQLRAMFIRTCKSSKACRFEGGLLSRNQSINQSINQYTDVLTDKYFPSEQYLQNTKKSAFVFNSPAAWACHGWKLGEYLAMGKAIISTPFINEMPERMIHGENILFVNNENEMRDAVNLLLSDHELRIRLEKGAKEYYQKCLKPEVVINRLINR